MNAPSAPRQPSARTPSGVVRRRRLGFRPGSIKAVRGRVTTNPKAEPLQNPHIAVVCYNAAKKIVGGGFAFPDTIPPSGKAVAEVDLLTAGKSARCDAYGTPSAI
jgi:hypothetical protein